MRHTARWIDGFSALILFVVLFGNDSLLKGQTMPPNTVPPNTVAPKRGPTGGPAANGPILQTTGRTTQSQPLLPGHIPNTGGPGGSAPAPPQANQPQRPQQVLPNNGQPFPQLTVKDAADLDRLLDLWEKKSSQISYFETKFQFWKYGADLLNQNESSTYGILRYVAPNKGTYEELGLVIDGKAQEASAENHIKYLTTGDKIYEYDFVKKHVSIFTVPVDQREGIVGGGPMPFVFGAKAADLKKRYYLRIIYPADREGKGEVWLEAFPRTPEDANEFKAVQLIFDEKDLTPLGFVKFDVNGKERDSYKFLRKTMTIKMKGSLLPDLTGILDRPVPAGWTKEEIELPSQTPQPAPVQPRVAAPQEVQEIELYTPPSTPAPGGSRPQF